MSAGERGALFFELWERQRGRCAICNGLMARRRADLPHASLYSKLRATFDHIRPLSRGGADGPDNIQLACRSCNLAKGDTIVSG